VRRLRDRRRKKTRDNYPIHKTEDDVKFICAFRYFDPIAARELNFAGYGSSLLGMVRSGGRNRLNPYLARDLID
jgi:hypothetical protein